MVAGTRQGQRHHLVRRTGKGRQLISVELDKASAFQALENAVQEYGEYWVDPNAGNEPCKNFYQHGEERRNCIAAKALLLIEPKLEPYILQLSPGFTLKETVLELNVFSDVSISASDEALSILSWAQVVQDAGVAWGSVFRATCLAWEYRNQFNYRILIDENGNVKLGSDTMSYAESNFSVIAV